jgi:cytochrome c553
MRLERRGREFWAEFEDPDSIAEPRPRITRQVVLITGSHQQQVYWYRTGRSRLLGQLPAMYMIAEGRWIPRRSAFMRPPTDGSASETGRWNGVCINCHATHGKWKLDRPVPAALDEAKGADTSVAELGIACEACHGASAEHVRLNRNPLRRYGLHVTGRPDRTIVQPSRLDPKLSSQVCGQCHGVWNYYDRADEQRVNSNGLPYRPGDDLQKTRFVAQPTKNLDSPITQGVLARDPGLVRDSIWSDGMIRVSGREYNGLIESPCFKDAPDAKKMSCSSCHSMPCGRNVSCALVVSRM